jgi:hypothetical protein
MLEGNKTDQIRTCVVRPRVSFWGIDDRCEGGGNDYSLHGWCIFLDGF